MAVTWTIEFNNPDKETLRSQVSATRIDSDTGESCTLTIDAQKSDGETKEEFWVKTRDVFRDQYNKWVADKAIETTLEGWATEISTLLEAQE